MLLQRNFHYADFSDPDSLRRELKEEIAEDKVRAAYTDSRRLYTHAGMCQVFGGARVYLEMTPDAEEIFNEKGSINE